MRVKVYGSGLSAYLAVHAARTLGHEVVLVNYPHVPQTPESLYLGLHVPGIATLPYKLRRTVEGDPASFRAKADGVGHELAKLEEGTRSGWAWNPVEVLHELEAKYDHLMVDWSAPTKEFDFTVTALPADETCHTNTCDFYTTSYWETPFMRYTGIGDNCIVGSGDPGDWWHTCFNVPGARGTWYPYSKPPTRGHSRREAYTGTTCECNPEYLRVGPAATWDVGYRSELAFYDTLRALVEARA